MAANCARMGCSGASASASTFNAVSMRCVDGTTVPRAVIVPPLRTCAATSKSSGLAPPGAMLPALATSLSSATSICRSRSLTTTLPSASSMARMVSATGRDAGSGLLTGTRSSTSRRPSRRLAPNFRLPRRMRSIPAVEATLSKRMPVIPMSLTDMAGDAAALVEAAVFTAFATAAAVVAVAAVDVAVAAAPAVMLLACADAFSTLITVPVLASPDCTDMARLAPRPSSATASGSLALTSLYRAAILRNSMAATFSENGDAGLSFAGLSAVRPTEGNGAAAAPAAGANSFCTSISPLASRCKVTCPSASSNDFTVVRRSFRSKSTPASVISASDRIGAPAIAFSASSCTPSFTAVRVKRGSVPGSSRR